MTDTPLPSGNDPAIWLDWTTKQQALASDPARFAWVSANAGSGKTHVLTQRVIRLLLAGARPSAILCLTYTKAAAAEMSNRVFERLSEWATLPDSELSARIAKIEGEVPGLLKLAEARRLFAKALETPGGLKIQTIHAFCEALLHQFPLEANVAGHFAVLDDRAASVLLADARRSLLTATTTEEDIGLAQAFQTVLELSDESGLDTLLSDIVSKRTSLRTFFTQSDPKGGWQRDLRRRMSVGDNETVFGCAEQFWPLPSLSGSQLSAYIDLCDQKGGSNAQSIAYDLKRAVSEPDPFQRADILQSAFLSTKGEPYADSRFFVAAMKKADASLIDPVLAARDHVVACRERLRLLQMHEATFAALTLAERLIDDYEDLKKKRGQLDFEDLIVKTSELLTKNEDVGPWVHYKLDQGIDHILVDEAQDTSPVQWSVIQSLAQDFFFGRSAREGRRTLFAVGDEKQSIYSFQGARPERFSQERAETERKVRQSEQLFSSIPLPLSFRSTLDVLSAVDQVFASDAHARGLSATGQAIVHLSNRIGEHGSVDIWPMIAPEPVENADDWVLPYDATPDAAPANILATRIAAMIEQWVGHERIIEKGKSRLVEPSDILILVRKRDQFVGALTRALKKRGTIPVAGADRLVLTQHIAIQDLMALGRFVLLPEDDLSLAALIKSPLLNLTEEDLFELAAKRSDKTSLWAQMQKQAEKGRKPWVDAVPLLNQWIGMSRTKPVYDFFAWLLGPAGVRRQILSRLGSEASDILDEFLGFALDHETKGLPGLQSFISTLELEAPTVKREQDKGRNEVRIMTVHAAKGLEAPIVFLADSGGKAHISSHMPKLRLVDEDDYPIWVPNSDVQNSISKADGDRLKIAAEEEYRRLLYVAMTRAADRLIVCGYRGPKDNPECWHAMITSALSADAERCKPETFSAGGQSWEGLQWKTGGFAKPADMHIKDEKGQRDYRLPPDLHVPLPSPRRLPRPLSPSGANVLIEEDDGALIVPSRLFAEKQQPNLAAERGRIVHRFMQVLPTLPASERRASAYRYLERAVGDWSDEDKTSLVDQVFSVLENPAMTDVFATNSKAEVNIMGTLKLNGKDYAVSGRIDRLSDTGREVIITDYKTNRIAPRDQAQIPSAHIAQLALYREILKPLYPGKTIACALVYTTDASLFILSEAALHQALASLTTK